MPVAAFDFAELFTTKPGLLHVEQGFSAHRQQCLHVIAPYKAPTIYLYIHILFSNLLLFITFCPLADTQPTQIQAVCIGENTEPT